MQQLIAPSGFLIKLTQIGSACRLFAAYTETLENVPMLLIIVSRRFAPQAGFPGADMHDTGNVITVRSLVTGSKNNRVQANGQILPVGQNFQKFVDVAFVEDMPISLPRSLAVDDDRARFRSVVIVRAETSVVFLLYAPFYNSGSGFPITLLHRCDLQLSRIALPHL